MSDIKNVLKYAVLGATAGLFWVGCYKVGEVCGRIISQAVSLGSAAKATRAEFDTIVSEAQRDGNENWRSDAQVKLTVLWYDNCTGIIRDKRWTAVTDAIYNRFQLHLDAVANPAKPQE